MSIADVQLSLDNLRLERDAIALYDTLAAIEKDERRAGAFRTIAGNERRHAQIWADRLREQGANVPPVSRPRFRVRFIMFLARRFGTRAVADLVQALEGDEEAAYSGQASPEVESIAADEREHAEIWKRLEAGEPVPDTPLNRPTAAAAATTVGPTDVSANGHGTRGDDAAAVSSRPVAAVVPASSRARATAPPVTPVEGAEIARREGWHRAGQSGTLRAVIFGVSDGLVSNLSLVMGVAGAAADSRIILLTGIAGLLAGAFSMAAGEYISMQSQRELYERQIALERAELEALPEEEEAELAGVYRSKGFTDEEARRIAHRIFGDPQTALDTLIREELGLDPAQLGSPVRAAAGSFVAFAVGAVVPVLPYLVGRGDAAFAVSLVLSLVALFAVGAGVSLLTGRSMLFSGVRQVAIGAAAATITNLVGRVVGVSVS